MKIEYLKTYEGHGSALVGSKCFALVTFSMAVVRKTVVAVAVVIVIGDTDMRTKPQWVFCSYSITLPANI